MEEEDSANPPSVPQSPLGTAPRLPTSGEFQTTPERTMQLSRHILIVGDGNARLKGVYRPESSDLYVLVGESTIVFKANGPTTP
jgi:hypothetical protein